MGEYIYKIFTYEETKEFLKTREVDQVWGDSDKIVQILEERYKDKTTHHYDRTGIRYETYIGFDKDSRHLIDDYLHNRDYIEDLIAESDLY